MASIWPKGEAPTKYLIYKNGVYLGEWWGTARLSEKDRKHFLIEGWDVVQEHDPYIDDDI